ncbi:MAG: flagellar filament capping protein FliD [Burkholderiaceae bacterium]|nr:flagellar filament capping protein FliD [Burkholderiaceae bacterium]
MATISSPGVGSSKFDLSGLLNQLRGYEEQPLARMAQKQKDTQTTLSAMTSLLNIVSNVKNAAVALGKADAFGTMKPTVTGSGFTATPASGAVAGSYQIKVDNLATSQVLRTEAVAYRKAKIGGADETGTLTIATADGAMPVSIALGEDTSLEGVAEAINGNDKVGVRATVVNDGQGHNFLMFSAKKSGAEAAVTSIAVAGNGALNDTIAYSADILDGQASVMIQTAAGADAELTINGIAAKSASNTVTGLIDNVSLTLTSAGGAAGTLDLAADKTVATTAVSAFVTAYNAMLTSIKSLTAYDAATQTGAPLTGDSVARGAQTSISGALRFSVAEGDLRSMAQVGITTNPTTGALTLDTAKLEKALTDAPADVARIFSGPGGLSERMDGAIKNILGDGGALKGSIASRVKSLEDLAANQVDQYEALEMRIAQTMKNYETQFTALSRTLATMESTQNYLTQQFELMANSKKK